MKTTASGSSPLTWKIGAWTMRDGGEDLDCLAAFTMYRVQYRWHPNHATVVLNTTVDAGGDRAGIRWAQTRSTNGQSAWTLRQDGTYAPADGIDRWMGSIAQNGQGDIYLGYTVANSATNPVIRYNSRSAGDPLGMLPGGELVCREGASAPVGSSRWGDYSTMSVDPVDDCSFWFTHEYIDTPNIDWQTRVCAMDPCSPPPALPRTTPFPSPSGPHSGWRECRCESAPGRPRCARRSASPR